MGTKMQNSSTNSSQNEAQRISNNRKQIHNNPSQLQSKAEEENSGELISLSHDSESSEDSDNGLAEETILWSNGNLEEEIQEDLVTQTQQGDLYSRVNAFIKQDPE